MMGCFQLSERKALLKKNSKLKVVPKKNSPGPEYHHAVWPWSIIIMTILVCGEVRSVPTGVAGSHM